MNVQLPLIPLPARIEGNLTPHTTTFHRSLHATIDPSRSDLSIEGYELRTEGPAWTATATSEAGMRNAERTYEQLCRLHPHGSVSIIDAPRMTTRAVMIDMARCTERRSYYYELAERIAAWKFNTLFVHFSDNEGCALRLDSLPEAAGPHAFTKQEMTAFIRYAAELGLEVIPELETFGHTGFILNTSAYTQLAEDERHTTLCTTNPETWTLLENLIAETAELFPSQHLHLGCDEARFGTCPTCVAAVRTTGEDALLISHLTRVCELARRHDKRPMLWTDLFAERSSVARALGKDTVLCHWDYGPNVDPEPVRAFEAAGFSVITCPAVLQGSRLILPRHDCFDNLESSAENAYAGRLPTMQTTIWNPERIIPDTLYLPLAYAAELSWSGRQRSREHVAAAFAQSFFGVPPSHASSVGAILLQTHSLSDLNYRHLRDPVQALREVHDRTLEVWPVEAAAKAESARHVATRLDAFARLIHAENGSYNAYQLAASVSLLIQERTLALLALHDACQRSERDADALPDLVVSRKEDATRTLRAVIERHETAVDLLDRRWSLRRYANDPRKLQARESLIRLLWMNTCILRSVEAQVDQTPDRIPAWAAIVDAAERGIADLP
jgi:hypothetical protein